MASQHIRRSQPQCGCDWPRRCPWRQSGRWREPWSRHL